MVLLMYNEMEVVINTKTYHAEILGRWWQERLLTVARVGGGFGVGVHTEYRMSE